MDRSKYANNFTANCLSGLNRIKLHFESRSSSHLSARLRTKGED